MPKNIIVFTTNKCGACHMIKKWLGAKGYKYEEINVEQQPEYAQQAFEMSGSLAVPVVLIEKQDNSQDIIAGFNISKLASALAL